MENLEKRKIPALNTQAIDLSAYDELRKHFFIEYIKFRRGNIKSGEPALNDLLLMYQVLPAIRHSMLKPTESFAFLKSIDYANKEIEQSMSKGLQNPTPDNVAMIDAIYREFGKIMYELNYTR